MPLSRHQQAAATIALLAVLFLVPLIISGRPYIDDLARTITGAANWSKAGRPLTDVAMLVANLGQFITDLSPLHQIAAIAVVGLGAIMIFKLIDDGGVHPVVGASAAALLLLNPFLLQNMAYKFDALPMGLAMLAAVAAALPGRRPIVSFAKTLLLVLVCLGLYQAAANLVPAIAIVVAVSRARRRERSSDILKSLLFTALGTATAFFVYVTLVPFLVAGRYATSHGGSVRPDWSGLATLASNLKSAGRLVLDSFSPAQLALLVALTLLACVGALVQGVRLIVRRDDSALRLLLAPIVMLSPAALLVLAFGTSALLESPVFQPRTLIAFGAFLVLAAYLGTTTVSDIARILRQGPRAVSWLPAVVVAPILLLSINIAFAFGNAQSAQGEYDQYVAVKVSETLRELGMPNRTPLVVDGVVKPVARAAAQIRKYPIVGKLLAVHFRDRFSFGPILLRYYGVKVSQAPRDKWEEARAAARELPPDVSAPGFTLTRTGDALVLRFD